jgi:hypothetical protein
VLVAALAAAVLASATLVAESVGWLGWLDAVMLRVISPAVHVGETGAAADLPQLVLIDQQAYADRFGLRSPLPRKAIVELLADVEVAKPKLLVLDLQLEPALEDDAQARLSLDQSLLRIAKMSSVVLPIPEARVDALDRESLSWMQLMCRGGVSFGLPDIQAHFGTVVRLEQTPFALGNIARSVWHPGARHEEGAVADLCSIALNAKTLANVRREASKRGAHAEEDGAPLRPGIVQRVLGAAIPWRDTATAELLRVIRPRAIVVGGSYDDRDAFLVAGSRQPVPGGVIHVAAIVSDVKEAGRFVAWGIDVALGTVVGLVFLALWKAVHRAGKYVAPNPSSTFRLVAAAHVELALTLLVWLLAVVVMLLLFLSSGWFMEHDLWLNPGPMVAGVFLHTLLLKEEQALEVERHRSVGRQTPLAAKTSGRASAFLRDHPLFYMQLVVIVISWVCALSR